MTPINQEPIEEALKWVRLVYPGPAEVIEAAYRALRAELAKRYGELEDMIFAHSKMVRRAEKAEAELATMTDERNEWERRAEEHSRELLSLRTSNDEAKALREALIRLMSKVQIQHGNDRLGEAWDYAVEALATTESAPCVHGGVENCWDVKCNGFHSPHVIASWPCGDKTDTHPSDCIICLRIASQACDHCAPKAVAEPKKCEKCYSHTIYLGECPHHKPAPSVGEKPI